MTKKVTRHEADDTTTSRGTVKGHHPRPGDDVTEGGAVPPPKDSSGAPRASTSKAAIEGTLADDGTTSATGSKVEKQYAAAVGASKTQSGRGHRKHED